MGFGLTGGRGYPETAFSARGFPPWNPGAWAGRAAGAAGYFL